MAVRGNKVKAWPAQTDEGKKPKCPEHKQEMSYHAEEDNWTCPALFCNKTATRKRNFGDLFDADDHKPVIYRGAIELVNDHNGRVYLYLVDVNGMVDVTEVLKANG